MKMPTYLPDVLDSWDYATLLNEAKYNANPSGGKIKRTAMKRFNGSKMEANLTIILILIGLILY